MYRTTTAVHPTTRAACPFLVLVAALAAHLLADLVAELVVDPAAVLAPDLAPLLGRLPDGLEHVWRVLTGEEDSGTH